MAAIRWQLHMLGSSCDRLHALKRCLCIISLTVVIDEHVLTDIKTLMAAHITYCLQNNTFDSQ